MTERIEISTPAGRLRCAYVRNPNTSAIQVPQASRVFVGTLRGDGKLIARGLLQQPRKRINPLDDGAWSATIGPPGSPLAVAVGLDETAASDLIEWMLDAENTMRM